jgi:TolB-like protein/Flp pilus assembly protein TadD
MQSRARHSLEQLLYELRASIDEAVFASANPVRLNPDVMRSDVGAFAAAIEGGDLEAAIGLYRGPFLDGFYLDDAPEFERWVESERTRLAGNYVGTLEQLAQRADTAPDHGAAVRWWRMLSEADPVSSRNATGLIRALVTAGDSAAALQYADRYEAVVARELGTTVDPAVASLVAEVRAKASPRPMASSKPPPLPRTRPTAAPVSAEVTPNDPPSPNWWARRRLTPRAIAGIALAVLIATAGLLRATMRDRRPPPPEGEPSLAVLPFVNVTRNPQDAPLVDGLSEELIAVLAKLGELRVTARTSAFVFKNSDADVRRIADSLGVSYILEGGVQRADSQVRVDVRLIDARDASTRWSETYDRKLREIFSVQSDIASEIARELDVRLGRGTLAHLSRRPTSSIAAYELYLRGNDPAATRNDSLARTGLEYFRQAIALDSTYAAAYAGLARMHVRLGYGDDAAMSRRDHLVLAERAALKAVALDDSLGEAHASLGFVRRENLNLASAKMELERAVMLEPTSARFHELLAQTYGWTDHPAEALAEAHRALTLDPLSPNATAEVARALVASGRCDEALALLAKLSGVRPPLLRARSIAAQCYARKGMWPEAIAEAQQNVADGGLRGRGFLGHVLARAGRADEARGILAALLDHDRRAGTGAFEIAAVYAGLGEKDRAFAWLDKAVREGSITFDHLPAVLDVLGPDPRLADFRRRLGVRVR